MRLHLVALQRSGLLPHLNLTTRLRVGTGVFRAPVSQGIGLGSVDPEPWLDVVLTRLLSGTKGGFVDVGANLGQTLLKVKAVSRSIDYWGFEPNPRCYCYLEQLIAVNQLPACRVYPFALGEAAAFVELFHTSPVDPAASVVSGFRPPAEYASRQFVSLFPGDEVLREAGPIAAIKIDVEGGELEVLLGLLATIRRARPGVLCEVLPVYDDATEIGRFRLDRQLRIESLLHEQDYSMNRIELNGELTKIDSIGVHKNLLLCNYLFLPN